MALRFVYGLMFLTFSCACFKVLPARLQQGRIVLGLQPTWRLLSPMFPEIKKSASKAGIKETILSSSRIVEEIRETMPPNRIALYKCIMEFRALKASPPSVF